MIILRGVLKGVGSLWSLVTFPETGHLAFVVANAGRAVAL